MTARNERDQKLREFKEAMLARVAGRAMSTRTKGLDGLAKSLLERGAKAPDDDHELDHPADWDRPID